VNLYIVRHASAKPGTPDEKRELSDEGIREAEKVKKFITTNNIRFECCISSPLERALHTAQILKGDSQLIVSSNLQPSATPPKFISSIPGDKQEILIVGHQPDLGRFISFLISGGTLELEFALGTCSMAKVEVDKIPLTRPGRLGWMVTPSILP
jgi:phosphohistidine phosphatase